MPSREIMVSQTSSALAGITRETCAVAVMAASIRERRETQEPTEGCGLRLRPQGRTGWTIGPAAVGLAQRLDPQVAGDGDQHVGREAVEAQLADAGLLRLETPDLVQALDPVQGAEADGDGLALVLGR